ncbi:MAG: hypothetical protein V3T22_06675, partial [Planctomycetota bacterium]
MLPHFCILVGPGERLSPLVTLLTSLRAERLGPEAPLTLRALRDVEGLLHRQGPAGLVLLDADGLDPEDLGIVRRFVQRHAGWELILTGDDDRSRIARRLSSLRRVRWLPWPLDVDQLTAMLTPAPAAAPAPGMQSRPDDPRSTAQREGETSAVRALPTDIPTDLATDVPTDIPTDVATGHPTGHPSGGDLADSLRAVLGTAAAGAGEQVGESLETSLAEDLASIEAILRGEAQAGIEPRTAPASDAEEDVWDGLQEDGHGPQGLELTREEMEAFLAPTEEETSALEQAPSAEQRPQQTPADRPPTWFKAQVGDLIDMVQGLDLSARLLRESRAEDSPEARENSARRLEGDVLRLVQFARTLGYLAAPPECGGQRIALCTLLEEQLGGLAGSHEDSPRFLFRAEQEAWVRSDKALLVATFDALLQVAAACSTSSDVVRVAVEPDEQSGQVEVHVSFPGRALAQLSPAEVLAPYGLRGVLPGIGANALAAASRILEGQGGRLALGQDERGDRLLFRVRLPLAADDHLPRPGAEEVSQKDSSITGE